MFRPTKVLDIELSHPLTTIENLDDYDSLQVLARLHGTPIGYVKTPVINGRCTAAALAKTILEQHNNAIVHHLLCDGLAAPPQPGRLCITDLLTAQHPVNSGPLPLVTVAVCTRDRTAELARCLDSLNHIDYPTLDIMVVDNAPGNDATEHLVRSRYPGMRYVCEPRPGLDWARNRAIIEARGEVIAYTDDDTVVDPGWVRALAEVFSENPEVMAVTGLVVPYELETEAQIFFELRGGFGRGFKRKWYQMDKKNGKSVASLYGFSGMFGTGANMAFRRNLFDQIGNFDTALDVGTVTNGGGDSELFFRLLKEGCVLVYEPSAVVRHCHRRNYRQLRNQMASWGNGFYAYLVRSALHYPDERFAIIKLGLWFLRFQIHRLLNSFVRPVGYPRDLLLAQLFSSFFGPICYLKARRSAAKIAQDFGPITQVTTPNMSVSRKTTTNRQNTIAERTIDLSQPLYPLTDILNYPVVRVFIARDSNTIGSVDIVNNYRSISVARLRDTIVENLNFRLLEPDNLGMDSLQSHLLKVLTQHYIMKNVESS